MPRCKPMNEHCMRQTAASLSRHRVRVIVRSYLVSQQLLTSMLRGSTRHALHLPSVETGTSPLCRRTCGLVGRALLHQEAWSTAPGADASADTRAKRKSADARTGSYLVRPKRKPGAACSPVHARPAWRRPPRCMDAPKLRERRRPEAVDFN